LPPPPRPAGAQQVPQPRSAFPTQQSTRKRPGDRCLPIQDDWADIISRPRPPSHRAVSCPVPQLFTSWSFSRSRQCQTPQVRSENERDPRGAPLAALGRCPAGCGPQAKVPAQERSAPAAQEVSSRRAPRHRPDPQGSLEPADASLLPRPQACVRARMRALRVPPGALLGAGQPHALHRRGLRCREPGSCTRCATAKLLLPAWTLTAPRPGRTAGLRWSRSRAGGCCVSELRGEPAPSWRREGSIRCLHSWRTVSAARTDVPAPPTLTAPIWPPRSPRGIPAAR
jgi:hypothetical protein